MAKSKGHAPCCAGFPVTSAQFIGGKHTFAALLPSDLIYCSRCTATEGFFPLFTLWYDTDHAEKSLSSLPARRQQQFYPVAQGRRRAASSQPLQPDPIRQSTVSIHGTTFLLA